MAHYRLRKNWLDELARCMCSTLDSMKIRRQKPVPKEHRAKIKALLRRGDVILESDAAFPLWQLAAFATTGQPWTHAALYIGEGKVIDAGKKSFVSVLSVDTFLRSRSIAIVRPKFVSLKDADEVVELARQFIGTPYNECMRDVSEGNEVYCTQLIATCFAGLSNPIEVPSRKILFRRIVTPDRIIKHKQFQVVYNSLSRPLWPTAEIQTCESL